MQGKQFKIDLAVEPITDDSIIGLDFLLKDHCIVNVESGIVTIDDETLYAVMKKTQLDKVWYNQDIVCDFETPLRITNNITGTPDLILIDNENEELITEEYRIIRSEPS